MAINFDIFAYGDTVFGIASHRSGKLATSLDKAAERASMPLRLGTDRNRYPASDHRIMMTAGIETLGLALIDGSEIDSILQPSTVRPAIMSIIHTAGDVIDRVRPDDIDRAFAVVEQALRLLDAPQ